MNFRKNLIHNLISMSEQKNGLYGKMEGFIGPSKENQLLWYKFLTYTPKWQKEYIEQLIKKQVSEISREELDYIKEFEWQQHIVNHMRYYITSNCRVIDFKEVTKYLNEHSLNNIIKLKLTEEELNIANGLVNEYLKTNNWINWVRVNKERINELSIIESYVWYKLNTYKNEIGLKELEDKINNDTMNNEVMLIKSLRNADEIRAI